ncbi:hypothetical protein B1J94_10950 [Leptospira kirschneri serovar Grippotyphosa]|nr:hypothetical protein B1J94_10950 [Leptospira kirschneri serovar Grippotyphosa]
MNSPSVSISWKRAIEIVLLNATVEFFNNSIYKIKWLLIFIKLSILSFCRKVLFQSETLLLCCIVSYE